MGYSVKGLPVNLERGEPWFLAGTGSKKARNSREPMSLQSQNPNSTTTRRHDTTRTGTPSTKSSEAASRFYG
jgi:hypothetical protein